MNHKAAVQKYFPNATAIKNNKHWEILNEGVCIGLGLWPISAWNSALKMALNSVPPEKEKDDPFLITLQEIEVLSRMKEDGLYLVKNKNGEGLSYDGNGISQPVKAGTIQRLNEEWLIFKPVIFDKKFILTEKGKKFIAA